MGKLTGKRVALAGPRKAEELSRLVANLGGIPLIRPAQGTVFLDDSHVEQEIHDIIAGAFDWLIATTGVGLDKLHQAAEAMGRAEEFAAALGRLSIAARGYKTVNMLKKWGLQPLVRDDDGSTAGLMRELASHDLRQKRVALQLHGDPAPKLVAWLEEQGAEFHEILPYHHVPPKPDMLELLVGELLAGDIDAVNFTSTPQARFLMEYAREKGVAEQVLAAFAGPVVAVAVGKVTAQALREAGITRIVVPEEERMGSAIVKLAQYYEQLSSF
ncbi:uroporphyrinogen-III synthase [Ectobacillus ponti]|uniref:Uroporphyrinogen-III synthase n=1 Tax=Ectobacillus ponti TaxID=2961894 RepID=A0AA41X471_9BACI|nr:uroporphyrinogen-III synthase [Ectobacillus ponti]MCP8968402.1 uroporphyrinogen-III synthase [Ectobacillus ponti]